MNNLISHRGSSHLRTGSLPARTSGELFEYLIAIGVVSWFATVQLPLIALNQIVWDADGVAQAAETLRFVPASIVFLLAVDLAFVGRLKWYLSNYARRDASGLRWMFIAATSVFVASIFQGNLLSVMYSIILLFVTTNMAMLWLVNVRIARLAFRAMFVISALTAFIPLLMYGTPVNRFVGGIHPNSYGAVMMSFAFFWVLGFDRFNVAVLGVALGLTALVSSRYSLLSIVIFSIFVLGFDRRMSLASKTILAMVGMFVLLLPPVWALLLDVFLVGDVDRGIGAGVSGRFDMYTSFLPQIERSPWIGYGFRARDMYEPSHNGFLTSLLENGLVVGGLLFAWLILRFYKTVTAALITGQSVYAHVAGGLIAVSAGAFFQPQLFNFGDAMGLSLLLFLVAPVLTRQSGGQASVILTTKRRPLFAAGAAQL